MTHGFLYGTATFEGIRAYWNEEQEQLYGLKLLEHYKRLWQSAKVLLMKPPMAPEQLVELTVDLLRRNNFRQDAYIRPTLYKSTEAIGVRLHNLEDELVIFAVPFGEYIAIDRGISAQVVSWRRNSDQSMPARAKIVGAYVNSAFSKTEAVLNGYDEAIVLTMDGHVSEGSAENFFMVRNGKLVTPAVTDDILEGVTRAGLIQLAREEHGHGDGHPLDRPERAVRRPRRLPVRHRCADVADRRDRSPARRRRRGRTDHAKPGAALLRHRARQDAAAQQLADADLLIGRPNKTIKKGGGRFRGRRLRLSLGAATD